MFDLYCLIQTILQKLNEGGLIVFFCSHFYSFFRDDYKFIYHIWISGWKVRRIEHLKQQSFTKPIIQMAKT